MSDTDGRGEESENRYLIRSLSKDDETFGNVADRRWHCVQKMIRFRKRGHHSDTYHSKDWQRSSTSWTENCHRLVGNTWNNSFDGITGGISIRRYVRNN